ncbi:RNA-binding region RNP-1 (RNA recognition motif) [Minicystis rosea]|nr:RNA-binding region RNP-1 (RNA recognition motif) [Minicystis rosea]
MLGFVIGTLCLIGLIKTLRWGRRRAWAAYGYGGGCGGGYGRYGGGCGEGWDGGGWGGYREHGGHHGGWGGHHGGWGGHHGGWGGYREHGGFGGGWGGPSVLLHGLFRRLATTPGQEKVIREAIDEVRAAAREARGEARASRADLAKAMRSPAIDEVLFGEMFARHDVAMESLRKATIGALAKVHDALDEKQRAELASLIESGPGFFRGPWGGQASL